MKNKVLGLILVGMLSIGVVGCEEYQEPQEVPTQQEVVDEDLTKEYQTKTDTKQQLETAKRLVGDLAEKHLLGVVPYEITTDEESNTVMINLKVDVVSLAQAVTKGDYPILRDEMIETTRIGKELLASYGLNTHYAMTLGNIAKDQIWLVVIDGTVLYDYE